jgi:hypothetical protein
MLRVNLKVQDDIMQFHNTPNFNKRRAVSSTIDLLGVIIDQIFVYSDYGLKPGKHQVIIYDCFDQTLWYKTVIVGLRERQVVFANIMPKVFDFSKIISKDKCMFKFPKIKYFADFVLEYE